MHNAELSYMQLLISFIHLISCLPRTVCQVFGNTYSPASAWGARISQGSWGFVNVMHYVQLISVARRAQRWHEGPENHAYRIRSETTLEAQVQTTAATWLETQDKRKQIWNNDNDVYALITTSRHVFDGTFPTPLLTGNIMSHLVWPWILSTANNMFLLNESHEAT